MQRMNRSRKSLMAMSNKLSASSSFPKRRKISSFLVVVAIVILGTIPVVFSLVWFATFPPSITVTPPSSSSSKIYALSRQQHTISSSFTPVTPDMMKNACDTHHDNYQKSLFRQDWKMIDALLETPPHNRDKVSGGIFLYPRQTSLLYTIVSQLALHLQSPRPLQICETGYGAGHSASLFFHAATELKAAAEIHSFDKFDRSYQTKVWKLLHDKYSSRSTTTTKNQTSLFHHYKGDSCRTVPQHLSPSSTSTTAATPKVQCDFIHGSSLCGTDNIDLVEHSPCGVILTSTAMKSLQDNKVYFGRGGHNKKTHPPAQWRALRERQCIRDIVCFEENAMELNTNFVFAAKGERMQHKFCMAITTGKCQKQPKNGKELSTSTLMNNNTAANDDNDDGGTCNPNTDIYRAVQQFGNLRNFCPKYQVDIPE